MSLPTLRTGDVMLGTQAQRHRTESARGKQKETAKKGGDDGL